MPQAGTSLVCSRKSQEATVTGPGGGETSKRWHRVGARGWSHRTLKASRTVGFNSADSRNSLEDCEWEVEKHIFLFYPDSSGCFMRVVCKEGSRGKVEFSHRGVMRSGSPTYLEVEPNIFVQRVDERHRRDRSRMKPMVSA